MPRLMGNPAEAFQMSPPMSFRIIFDAALTTLFEVKDKREMCDAMLQVYSHFGMVPAGKVYTPMLFEYVQARQ